MNVSTARKGASKLSRFAYRPLRAALLLIGAGCAGLAQATTVADPCQQADFDAALAATAAGGTIDFACSEANRIIRLAGATRILNQNLTIDGANAAGTGMPIELSGRDSTGNFLSTTRLFDILDNTQVTLRNITLDGFRSGDFAPRAVPQSTNEMAGAIFNLGQLLIENVTLSNNLADESCGAILQTRDAASLTIRHSFITRNEAGLAPSDRRFGGGAICILRGSLAVSDTSFFLNRLIAAPPGLGPDDIFTDARAGGLGGGAVQIVPRGNVTASFTRSEFRQNAILLDDANGGALLVALTGPNADAIVTITDSVFDSNTVNNEGGLGGAIANHGATVNIHRSSFFNNFAGFANGAIHNFNGSKNGIVVGGQMSLINSTVAENFDRVAGNGGISSFNGEIFDGSGTADASVAPFIDVQHSTIANNGGGVNPQDPGGRQDFGANVANDGLSVIRLHNTIVAGGESNGNGGRNCGVSGAFVSASAVIIASGNNLDTDGSCIAANTGAPAFVNNAATPAGLGPLQPGNGNPMSSRFMDLMAGSAALDAAELSDCAAVDQRAISRPQPDGAARCDLGAVESSLSNATPTPAPTATPTPQPTTTPQPTPTPVPTPVPTATATPQPSPAPTSSPVPTPAPTATPASGPAALERRVSGGTSNVILASFSVANPNSVAATLTQLGLPLQISAGQVTDVRQIRLLLDQNADGRLDAGDTLIATRTPAQAETVQPMTLSPALALPPGASASFIVVVDFR